MTFAPFLPSSAGEPPPAALLARGVCRAFDHLGYASLVEFPLANGRRADVLALGKGGDLVIVEIKSSVADFRADHKWPQLPRICRPPVFRRVERVSDRADP